MKALIVGLGSIGRRHVKNLKVIDPKLRIAVLREHSKESEIGDVRPIVEGLFFKREEAVQWKPDAVFVTNPAVLHMKTALAFLPYGCHLFIEKPLSDSLDNIDLLLKECRKRNAVLMVGYVLRFLRPLRLLKELVEQGKIGRIVSIRASVGRYLPDWRPGTDYQFNVSARKELGGGVVFELSHELDYVRWIAGEVTEVSAFLEKASDFKIDVEDIAEINLRFENKAVGNVHLDMVDRAENRSCRIVGTEGTLVWDSHCVRFYAKGSAAWVDLWNEPSLDYNQMFLDELGHFLTCVKDKSKPLVTAEDGWKVLEIALAAKRSAKEGKTIKI